MCKDRVQKSNLLIIISFLLLSFSLFSFSACIGERIAPIEVHNNTEETLSIFINNDRVGNVASGEEIKNKWISITVSFVIEARNSQEHTIYKEKIILDDMERMDWRVIIPPQTEKMSSDNITKSSDNITEK